MSKDSIIRKVEEFAREKMKGYDPGHDWWHVMRVRHLAKHINSFEKSADPFTLDVAAILHDVSDSKFRHVDEKNDIEDFLNKQNLQEIKEKVMNAIGNISFSNKDPRGDLKDPVFMILQDADRLDAIGAIGIARAFSYGAFKGNPVYIPSDETGGVGGTTIHHFYDKLLRLKGLMNTDTGKSLAGERHQFLEKFLEQFYKEWQC